MTTTHLGAPMELLGAQPGISVIDPSSVLTRLWYFDGRFLRAEGFRLDQAYVRSLVALSNQAVGHGVVHGFDVDRASGDRLVVEGGLALALSGRVIHLPQQVELSIPELIARSTGEIDPGSSPSAGTADFSPCPPEDPGDPVVGIAPRQRFVLTVAATEALCGEEERFGQLCEDACATETDRSVAIEGARFRVRELRLDLPVSTRIPFDAAHARSRVAMAYFERERSAVPSRISGAGLRSGVWCDGAEGISGEELPLAVFERSGTTTTWLDMWTVRRELVETTPQRYWGWRFAMRPLDVFLAQVLQFQCQLLDLGSPGGGEGGPFDPCADERAALAEVGEVLGIMSHDSRLLAGEAMASGAGRLTELRKRITAALKGREVRSATGSLLLDGGIVTLPSGGYLPVDPSRSIDAQVQALMGPGVDLRFCAVRPDFVPEALHEAQHMERISLTRGIDDPADLEEVDVLVPGGTIERRAAAIDAFEGRVRILPSVRRRDDDVTVGSALTLAAVARDQVQEGWSWSLAAHGEAPQRLHVTELARGLLGEMVRPVRAAGDVPAEEPAEVFEVYVDAEDAHERTLTDASFHLRLNRERVRSRERYEAAVPVEPREPIVVTPDRPIERDEKRPVSLWLDLEVARDLRELAVGGTTAGRLRVSVYSRARTEPVLFDVKVEGSIAVTDVRTRPSRSGTRAVEIRTTLSGFADPLVILGQQVIDEPPRPIRDVPLRWRITESAGGVRILEVAPDTRLPQVGVELEDRGAPRRVQGALLAGGEDGVVVSTGEWTEVGKGTFDGARRLADLELLQTPGALDPGTLGREMADAVIEVIATELALRGRDTTFGAVARRRLLEPERADGDVITSSADWVMFHRRRTKDCGGVAPAPKAVRRFPWFHAVIDVDHDVEVVRALSGRAERDAAAAFAGKLDAVGFEPVTTVEFLEQSADLHSSRSVLRAAWASTERGLRVLAGVVASPPTGEGTSLDLQRLSTATGAVADLVDLSRMQVRAVSEIPPEFQSPGIDGALFTIAIDRREVELTRALLVRASEDRFERLRGVLPNVDVVTGDVLRELLGGELDTFLATFDGSTLLDEADVLAWWGGIAVELGGVGISGAAAAEPDPLAAVQPRLDALRDALGVPRYIHLEGPPWRLDEEVVVVLVQQAAG